MDHQHTMAEVEAEVKSLLMVLSSVEVGELLVLKL
jgi:hypothetical protein